jgi:hypothetical protein
MCRRFNCLALSGLTLAISLLPSLAWGAVDTLKATGNGTTANWSGTCPTNAWECVDEDAPDSLTTTINATVASTIHELTIEDPTQGTIDSVRLTMGVGYTTGPNRLVDVGYDTGAGFVDFANLDLGNEWSYPTIKFTSPDSLHIANLQVQIELLEDTKTGNQMHLSWVEVLMYYTAAATGKAQVMRTNIID